MTNQEYSTCKICSKKCAPKGRYAIRTHVKNEHGLSMGDYMREYYPELGGYCKTCGKPTNFISPSDGFQTYCSPECQKVGVSKQVVQTCMERYGVENPFQRKDVIEKIRTKWDSQRDQIIQKEKDTYSKKTPEEMDEIKTKRAKTMLEKYGVENIFQSPELSERLARDNRYRNYPNTKKYFLDTWNQEILDSRDEYAESKVHRFRCNIHGITYKAEFYPSILCPECKKAQGSIAQNSIVKFLEDAGFDVLTNRRDILPSGKELDIWIPNKNLAIEFDGLYYHSALHGTPRTYHLNKTLESESLGIQLIHIFESEWISKPDIVRSVLLSKLGVYNSRIYARKCQLVNLDSHTYKSYCEKWHLAGYAPAEIKMGLEYSGELVSLIGVSKPRFLGKKDNPGELVRYCVRPNTQIVGGFSKLLGNVPRPLVSYCDRRWSNGSGYLASGWELIGTSAPRYHYFKIGSCILENRMKYQKKNLKKLFPECDLSMTEHEIMQSQGYNWIWDCGTLKMRLD